MRDKQHRSEHLCFKTWQTIIKLQKSHNKSSFLTFSFILHTTSTMMLIQWAPLEQGNTVRYRSNTSCNRIRCKRKRRPTSRRLCLRNQRRMIRRLSSLQRHRARIFSFKSQLKALTPREMLEHHKDEQKRTHQHCWREKANPSPSRKLRKGWAQRRRKWQTQTATMLLLEHP